MFAQLLEARGFRVDRRLGLGATEIAFRALREGAIDVYPEYTGTGLLAILGEPPSPIRAPCSPGCRASSAGAGVSAGFRPWASRTPTRRGAAGDGGAVGSGHAERSARVGPVLRAGLTPDFIGRADGLPGLSAAYSLRFRSVQALLPAVKYQALAAGKVDVIDGYSTDGLIAKYDLVVLRDDRGFFPPYEAAALVGPDLIGGSPARSPRSRS